VQLGLEMLPQAQRDIGILGSVAGGGVDLDPVERDLALARTQQLLDRDRLVMEVALGERVHAMAVQARH
jgi:hypothetical protein